MNSTKYRYLFLLCIISLLPLLASAQLTRLTEKNLIAERDIYVDSKGIRYSDLITVEFKGPVVNIPRGEVELAFEDVGPTYRSLRQMLQNLYETHGTFTMKKKYPGSIWGENTAVNKRTQKTVVVPDFSQIVAIFFEKLVPIDLVSEQLRSHTQILWAQPPAITYLTTSPNDPRFTNGEQWGLSAVGAPNAWGITKGLSAIRISINDYFAGTGRRDTIVELASKLTGGEHVFGIVDGENGDHGTVVSSVAGAVTNNAYGIASLGWLPEIWPSYYPRLTSIKEAVDAGADVINMSWIGGDIEEVRDGVIYALLSGVICVAGAGNNHPNAPAVFYPASYAFRGDTGQVICVTATKLVAGNEKWIEQGYNYSVGSDPLNDPVNSFMDVAAPGKNIFVALPNGAFGTTEGSSVAAPMVSALASLILSLNPLTSWPSPPPRYSSEVGDGQLNNLHTSEAWLSDPSEGC